VVREYILTYQSLICERVCWLPVPQRICFEMWLMMCKEIHGLSLAYLSELCECVIANIRTWLSVCGDLVI